jgi:ribosomal protein L7/L12
MSQIACPNCGAPVDSGERACPYCGAAIKLSGSVSVTTDADFADVLEQIRRGNKIEAIKAYRAKTGAGLAEAKAAVEAMQAGQPVAVPQADWSQSGDNAGMLDEIQNALRRGNKIEAIKIYREMTGVGLKEAKDAVEAMQIGQPVAVAGAAAGAAFASSAALMDEVKRLLRANKKIEAIKIYREYFDVGLADAKNAVDAAETELKLQSPPPPEVDDNIPAFARPDAPPVGPTITPNPLGDEAQPPAWRKWLIGCSIAAVVFLCLCVVVPALLFIFNISSSGN